MFSNPTTVLIILLVVAIVFAIAAYQLVINKYYWGPKGPPKSDRNSKPGMK
jgi:hypothetical protein